MLNITKVFKNVHLPVRGVIVRQLATNDNDLYAETFDVGPDGRPINMHPITQLEAKRLSQALYRPETKKPKSFLRSEGFLPANVLHVDPMDKGQAIWYTPPQLRPLFFLDSLGLPSGKANVPGMIWQASRHRLNVWTVKGTDRPDANTKLFVAPFFNVGGSSGSVCIGSARPEIAATASLEAFITAWENMFFNSYFSHANFAELARQNIIQIWHDLLADNRMMFPEECLMPTKFTLQKLLK